VAVPRATAGVLRDDLDQYLDADPTAPDGAGLDPCCRHLPARDYRGDTAIALHAEFSANGSDDDDDDGTAGVPVPV
jgi:hypothetical protein